MFRLPKILSILFIFLSFNTILYTQAPDTIWTRTYGGAAVDDGNSIINTSENHTYVIAGSTNSYGAGISDYRLVKINENGDTLWTKTYGSNLAEVCNDAILTQEGGYIIVGRQGDYFDGNIYTVKTNAAGLFRWEHTYNGFYGGGIRQSTDGGYILAGATLENIYLVKTDTLGDTIWSGEYPGIYMTYADDVQEHIDYSSPTQEKYYLAVGCTGGGSSSLSWDGFVISADSIGYMIDSERYGRPSFGSDDWIASIEPTFDGNYIAAGATMTFGSGGYDVWLIKMNFMGDTLWNRVFGRGRDDCGVHATQDLDGGFIVVGYTSSSGAGGRDAYIIKTDYNGNLLWSKTVGGPLDEVMRKVIVTRKHEYIIAGYTESFGAGGRDAYVIKLGRDGSGIDDFSEVQLPEKPELFQNYPNPFNSSTLIEYYFPVNMEKANIEFYDVLGKRVGNFRSIDGNAGLHQIYWRPEDISSGIYFYKIQAGDYSETRQMMLIK